jgi:formylglycine-generating enzyme required for sulfatase activity
MSAPPGDEASMVLIPAGAFWMGSDAGRADERPRHRVSLDAYEIDIYEVTNARFARFVDAGGYANQALWSPAGWAWRTRFHVTQPDRWTDSRWNGPTQPVVGVSWYEADAFSRYVNKRLPTEAEWEKAARGTDERVYPWGSDWDPTRTNGPPGGRQTAPVGSYPAGASPYGVHDLAGNAWEWVADWWSPDYYASSPADNPPGPPAGTEKGFRGGSWFSSQPVSVSTTYREHTNVYEFGVRDEMTGFRCARSVRGARRSGDGVEHVSRALRP